MGKTRLIDVPTLPKHKFRHGNHCLVQGYPGPCWRNTATGNLGVYAGWQIIGWCANPPSEVMHGREGQIAMMFYSEQESMEIWQHYPLMIQEDIDAAILEHNACR